MKRITLTCSDDVVARLLSAIAEHPIITLTVEAAEPPGFEERETIAEYFIRRGGELQAEGVRNSQSTTEKLVREIRANMHRPAIGTALMKIETTTYVGGGGGGADRSDDGGMAIG